MYKTEEWCIPEETTLRYLFQFFFFSAVDSAFSSGLYVDSSCLSMYDFGLAAFVAVVLVAWVLLFRWWVYYVWIACVLFMKLVKGGGDLYWRFLVKFLCRFWFIWYGSCSLTQVWGMSNGVYEGSFERFWRKPWTNLSRVFIIFFYFRVASSVCDSSSVLYSWSVMRIREKVGWFF